MKITKSKLNLVKFIAVLMLLFSLPLFAVGKTVLQLISSKTEVSSKTNNSLQPITNNKPSVPTQGSDWTTYLHDPERTSASNETILSPANASQLTKLWSFQTADIVAASAAVVNGIVYIGSWDGYEYALNEATGALKWKTFLGRTVARPNCNPPELGITSSATVEDDVVYLGGGDAYWYALDAKTGTVLWKVFTGDNSADGGHYNWSSPLIYKGYAYIGVSSEGDCPLVPGQVLKVSLSEHKIVQTLNLVAPGEIGGGVWTSPSVDPATDTLFFSSGTATSPLQRFAQAVFSVDATTLTPKSWWTLPANEAIGDSDFDTTPILFTNAKGVPLVASVNKNGSIYVFNRNNIGAGPLWKQQIAIPGMCPRCENSTVSSNAFGQGTLYTAAGDSNIDGANYRGSVTALDPTTGKPLWQRAEETGPVISALVYTNGLIITAAGRSLEILDATTGRRLYSYTTGEVVYSTPVLAHGQIFMGSSDGKVYAFGLPTAQPVAAVSDHKCPTEWNCQDIANPVLAGSETISGNTLKVMAGGTGMRETFDQFHFVAQKVIGDSQVSVKVDSQESVGGAGISQLGLMARQSNDPGSPYYAVLLTSHTGVVVQYRSTFGGQTTTFSPMRTAKAPLYLRIQRIGDQFHAATSQDGSNYTLVPGGDAMLVMPDTLSDGLAVSSGNTNTMNTVVFNNWFVQLPTPSTFTSPPSTTSCPDRWTCSDIGNPAIQGSQSVRGETWTVQGSGTDIWNNADQFHFVWQHLSGDGSISVHITSHQASATYAKAGIMIRENLLPDSPYYAVFVETGKVENGIAPEIRYAQGLISQQFAGVQGPAPDSVYLKIVRFNHGTKLSAYFSIDGTHWTLVPNSLVDFNMENVTLAGIAITSHDPNAVSTATFDSIQLN